MRTLVVNSDTHGRTEGLNALRPLFAENDYIVHLGDGAADMLDVDILRKKIVGGYGEK